MLTPLRIKFAVVQLTMPFIANLYKKFLFIEQHVHFIQRNSNHNYMWQICLFSIKLTSH